MSRETDNPPPGPLGWGEPQRGNGEGEARPGAPRPDEKKTETTLTTRARINIPGSRPIPPIVVRETVDEPAGRDAPAPAPPAAAAGDTAGGGPGKKTSSWFEPKKPPASQGGPAPQAPADPPPADTPPGGHPAVTETPADGIPASWFRQHSDTPPAGTPLGLPPRPVGPTTGPATGDMPLPPVPPAAQAPPPRAQAPALPEEEDPVGTTMDLGGPFPPPPPADLTGTGPLPVLDGTGAGRPAAPEPGPAVPPPGPRSPAAVPEPAGSGGEGGEAAPPPKAAKPKPKGRSKLKLLMVAVVGAAVVAYGAGLYLSPEDVPKGTTVLGIDIGGLSAQEATSRLDSQLEAANNEPVTVLIGEQEAELKPSVAGLSVDTEATVRASSGQDYGPVAVYGSLLGAERTAEAVFSVDREKLTVALDDLAEGQGSGPVEGGIDFENGEAIGRLGEPGTAVDLQAAADAVESAFRDRAATGRNPAVELPMTTQEPEVDEAEVQRAMEEFAEPAMSGLVTVRAGTEEISFSPQGTLPQFLSMEAVDGRLVDTYDLEVLEGLYGATFDGVLVTRGDGSQTPVTPEDVVGALREALLATDPAQRVGVIELDPS
ncbi:hypothetical protein [Streptomyces sp. MP131-18]|uniref:hypothetical protein n=1 Tax=Streptomyces sp. MP131-18 TaxID=1857892 RepID=UPI0009D37DEC|nr:hypothetical protein [Streptomyces sp. MP131-18]ONK11608.1 putative vancomycin resistance protein [Streptomyces sp. MP131-18]